MVCAPCRRLCPSLLAVVAVGVSAGPVSAATCEGAASRITVPASPPCLVRACQSSGVSKSVDQTRLRGTNPFEEGARQPFGSENASLYKAGIGNGSLVWLEDGVILQKVRCTPDTCAAFVPCGLSRTSTLLTLGSRATLAACCVVQGMIVMKFRAWVPERVPGALADFDAAAAAAAAVAVPEGEEAPAPLDALDRLLRARRACLLPLPERTLPSDITLTQLKTMLVHSPSLAVARTFAATTPAAEPPVTEVDTDGPSLADMGVTEKHLRLRELGLNAIPGRYVGRGSDCGGGSLCLVLLDGRSVASAAAAEA